MKKGIAGQVFIYIIALFLVAFIMIYGYKAIKTLTTKTDQITFLKFKTDLESAVGSISSDYGSVERKTFFIGDKYKKACFVTSYQSFYTDSASLSAITEPVIRDSVKSEVEDNAFLVMATVEDSFNAGDIEVNNIYHFLCIDVIAGNVKIQLEGKGDHAVISTW